MAGAPCRCFERPVSSKITIFKFKNDPSNAQKIRQTGVIRKSGSVTFPTNPHLPYCLALLGCLPDSSKTRGGPNVTAWRHRITLELLLQHFGHLHPKSQTAKLKLQNKVKLFGLLTKAVLFPLGDIGLPHTQCHPRMNLSATT